MKTFLKSTACLFILITFLVTGCKKDAIKVEEEKTYTQTNAPKGGADLGMSTGTSLTLKPGGRVDIAPPGDIVYVGSYKIRGKKLSINVPDVNLKFTYTIVSDTELRGVHGEILALQP